MEEGLKIPASKFPKVVKNPCAKDGRAASLEHFLSAARLSEVDVVYVIGCSGEIPEVATRHGCRCVELADDDAGLNFSRAHATGLGEEVEALLHWELLGKVTAEDETVGTERFPDPTVVFVAAGVIASTSSWLRSVWERSRHGVRIIACTQAQNMMTEIAQGFEVLDASEGLLVVPPRHLARDWAMPPEKIPVTLSFADSAEPAVMKGLLDAEDLRIVWEFVATLPCETENWDEEAAVSGILFGESTGGVCADSEDAFHGLREHRVVHLHVMEDQRPLRRVRAKLLRALYVADAKWHILPGRPVFVRSFEYHSYEVGGSVMDPEHRDAGSLLTISVLLGRSDDCEGGILRTRCGDVWSSCVLSPGDAVVFMSEKRHNVTPITCGTRQSMVMELWENGKTFHNRHA